MVCKVIQAVRSRLALIMTLAVVGCAICTTTASAATYQVYDGSLNTTYITYMRDTISSIGLMDNYVAFRSAQNTYNLAVGELVCNGNTFSSTDSVTLYTFTTASTNNGYLSFNQEEVSSFYLNAEDKLIYSDLGGYPQLMERGDKYEVLTVILIVAICVGYVTRHIFYKRVR